MLAVEAAGISGGMTVMDLCSAPGGKTTLAARKAGSGKVICGDVSERKAALILENTDRMKCSNVSVNVCGKEYLMTENTAVIINSGEPHCTAGDGDRTLLCIKFLPQVLFSSEQTVTGLEYLIPYIFENLKIKRNSSYQFWMRLITIMLF